MKSFVFEHYFNTNKNSYATYYNKEMQRLYELHDKYIVKNIITGAIEIYDREIFETRFKPISQCKNKG